jgi:hypothetical protein
MTRDIFIGAVVLFGLSAAFIRTKVSMRRGPRRSAPPAPGYYKANSRSKDTYNY